MPKSTVLAINALKAGSYFLPSLSKDGEDSEVQEAYEDLIATLKTRVFISSALQKELAEYQVEDLVDVLERHWSVKEDNEVLEAGQKLLSLVEQIVDDRYVHNQNIAQQKYKFFLDGQKIWTRFGKTVIFFGLLLILAGIVSTFLVSIIIGIEVIIGGISFCSFCSLCFRQAKKSAAQANEWLEKLQGLENIYSSVKALSSNW